MRPEEDPSHPGPFHAILDQVSGVTGAEPLTANGKIDRQALPAPEVDVRGEYVAPRSESEQQLAAIWAEVLGQSPIGIHDKFFELGGDSIRSLQVIARARAGGLALTPRDMLQHQTVAELATAARALEPTPQAPVSDRTPEWQVDAEPNPRWTPIVALQPHGQHPPLFCLPGVGGQVTAYHSLAQALGSEWPAYGLEYPGADGQQAPYTRVEAIAVCHLTALQAIQPTGPYYLVGHSFGGLMAIELALQLRRQGETTALVALLDCYPADRLPPLSPNQTLLAIVKQLLPDVTFEDDSDRDPLEQRRYLAQRLIEAGIFSADTPFEAIDNQLQLWLTNATMAYTPQVDAPLPVVLFQPEHSSYRGLPSDLGWQRWGVEAAVERVAGDHFSMLTKPQVETLARALKRHLAVSVPPGETPFIRSASASSPPLAPR